MPRVRELLYGRWVLNIVEIKRFASRNKLKTKLSWIAVSMSGVLDMDESDESDELDDDEDDENDFDATTTIMSRK